MDSFPPLLNSETMISIDLPSTASKEDNISLMSSDSCPLDIMGELQSADALDGLHSADAAAVTEIITSCLKDVDCSKVDVADVTSFEMEHLSINDEDYNELMEERRRQKTSSVSSLSFDDNLKNKIAEGASNRKESEIIGCGSRDGDVLKENALESNERKNGITAGRRNYKGGEPCTESDRLFLMKKENILVNAGVALDVDQDLDAISEIISSNSPAAVVNEELRVHEGGSEKDDAVKFSPRSQDNDLNLNSPQTGKEKGRQTEGGERKSAAAALSPQHYEGIETSKIAMHVVEFDQESNGEYEANSPEGSSANESGLRDRGGSSRNKPSKFASSSGNLRRILPKTASPASVASNHAAGAVDNTPSHPSYLETSIPSVVQEAMILNSPSPGVVTDGLPTGQYSFMLRHPQPNNDNQQHHPHPMMPAQAHRVITSPNHVPLHAGQQPLHLTGVPSPPYPQQQQQQQYHTPLQAMSPSQPATCQMSQKTMGHPYSDVVPGLHPGIQLYNSANSSSMNKTSNLMENSILDRTQNKQRSLSNSPQLPIGVGTLQKSPQQLLSQRQQQLQQIQQQHHHQYTSPNAAYLPYPQQSPIPAYVNDLQHQVQYIGAQNQLKRSILSNKQKAPKRLPNMLHQMGIDKSVNAKAMKNGRNFDDSVRRGKTAVLSSKSLTSHIPGSSHQIQNEHTVFTNDTINDFALDQELEESKQRLLSQNTFANFPETINVPNNNLNLNGNQIFCKDDMDDQLIQELGENFLTDAEREQLLLPQSHANYTPETTSTTHNSTSRGNIALGVLACHNTEDTQLLANSVVHNEIIRETLGVTHNVISEMPKLQPNIVHRLNQTAQAPVHLDSPKDKESLCLDDIQLSGELEACINQYLEGNEKTGSGGSGGRINPGSLDKYLNSDANVINHEWTNSQTKKVSGTSKKCGMSEDASSSGIRDGSSQLPTEVGNVDVNAWRQGGMSHGYGNFGKEPLNLYDGKLMTSNVNLSTNAYSVQNMKPQTDTQLMDLQNALEQQKIELLRYNVNPPTQTQTSYSLASNLPTTLNTSPNILDGPQMPIPGMEDVYNSRVSDQSMQSVENCLNNLSRTDSNVNCSRDMVRNNSFNTSLNIVGSADPTDAKSRVYKDKDIACLPQDVSRTKPSPSQGKNPPTQAKHRHSHHKPSSSSSESSQRKKRGRARCGQSMDSVADWITNHNGVGSGGGLASELNHPSMAPFSQEFHQQSVNDLQLPTQCSPIHRQPQVQHGHGEHYQQPQIAASTAPSNNYRISGMNSQAAFNVSDQSLSYQQQQQQLQRQRQRQHQPSLQPNYIPQRTNNTMIAAGLSSPNNAANRNLGQNQPLQSSLLTQTATTALPSSQHLHHQQLRNLQSRGSSPLTTKSSQSQQRRDAETILTTSSSSSSPPSKDSTKSNSNTCISSPKTTMTQNHNHVSATKSNLPLARNLPASQAVAAPPNSTTSGQCTSGLLSPMDSSSGMFVFPQKEMTSVEYVLESSDHSSMASSMASGMKSNPRWLESLGVDEEEETPLHLLWDMDEDQTMYQKFRENKNFRKVVNHLNNQQQTALFVAVVKETPHVVRFLVDSDADVNVVCKSDHKGLARGCVEYQTALHEAVERGNLEIAQTLLSYDNAEVDPRRRSSNMTPLMLALMGHSPPEKDNIKMIQILLRLRASLYTQDVEGKTPLMYMVMSGDVRVVKKVLQVAGVQEARSLVTMVTRKKMMTCLHFAAALKERRVGQGKKIELLKLLIEHGADPDKMNTDKQSPRHWASNEIAMVMSQLKTKTVTDGVCSNESPRNSPQYKPASACGGGDD